MTRNLLILLMLGLLAAAPSHAQEAEAAPEPSKEMTDDLSAAPGVGEEDEMTSSKPYVLQLGLHGGIAAAGINAGDQPEGRKTNVDFWFLPNYGVTVLAPFGAESKLSGVLDIGVSTTGTRTRPYELYAGKSNWSGYFMERQTWFSIAPSINLSGIMLGVGFNFPMKVERWNPDQDLDPHVVDLDLVKSMAMDIRVGGKIATWKIDIGTLFVDISARYQFGGVYNDGAYLYGYPTQGISDPDLDFEGTSYDFIPASASIGISYLFNLGF